MMPVFTKSFKSVKTKEGFRFIFYCDLCESAVETPEIIGKSYVRALEQSQIYAKRYFNMCHECGKWICDKHYNENEMKCVICSKQKIQTVKTPSVHGMKPDRTLY